MSSDKYVENTLTMPSSMPLFNYNINFEGLRNLLQTVNISTNTNTQNIQTLKLQVQNKISSQKFISLQKILDNSLKFGIKTEKLVDKSETSSQKIQRKQLKMMNSLERYCWKMNRLLYIIQKLVKQCQQNTQKVNTNDHKHQKHIDQNFRRIEEKVQSSVESITKNINMYFTTTNNKIGQIQNNIHGLKFNTQNTVQELKNQLNKRITQNYFKKSLSGIDQQVKASLQLQLKNDQMKRLTSLNQFSTKLKQFIKDNDIKTKVMKQNIKQISQKISKCFTSYNFQQQKHKIYDKLSEFRNKVDQALRRGQQFVDFRKNNLQNSQKIRQNILGFEDQIKKLKQKGTNFQKMQNIGSILQALDPHLICQLSSQVKLHEKQLGKLQQQFLFFQKELQTVKNNKMKIPQFNTGQTSQIVTKLIKDYMANLDFDGRVKRTQKQLHDISRRSEGVNDLQKKIYMITKQFDMGLIMKQIRKKMDQQSAKRDVRIVDSKIQKLFDFYKQLRKQLQQVSKKSMRNIREGPDSASLATKRLYPANCISCNPKQKYRTFSKNKIQTNLDESIDFIRHSIYTKNT